MRAISRRLSIAAAAAIVPVAAGLLPASAASPRTTGHSATATASAASTTRIAPVAGDGDYLVYVIGRSSHKDFIIGDNKTTGTLHVLTKSGRTRTLGAIGPEPGFELVGSILLESTFAGSTETTHWWNLASSKHGTTTETDGSRVVSAAPDGWLATTGKGGAHVVYHHTDGKVTDIKDPLPGSVDYAVSGGISGFTVAGDNDENGNGEIVYIPWAHLTRHTVLQKPQDGKENSCGEVGIKWAACGLDSTVAPLALIRLSDGKQVKMTKPCAFSAPALFSDTAAWVSAGTVKGCPSGRVEMFNTKGHVTTSSSHKYAWFVRAGALGWFVTSYKKQTALLGLKTANGKPTVLVTT
jgi:hypothetical protein